MKDQENMTYSKGKIQSNRLTHMLELLVKDLKAASVTVVFKSWSENLFREPTMTKQFP